MGLDKFVKTRPSACYGESVTVPHIDLQEPLKAGIRARAIAPLLIQASQKWSKSGHIWTYGVGVVHNLIEKK